MGLKELIAAKKAAQAAAKKGGRKVEVKVAERANQLPILQQWGWMKKLWKLLNL